MNLKRNYPLLLASQFISSFGDNVILGIILGQLTYLQKGGDISSDTLRTMNSLYTSLIFLPPIFLSPLCGYLNDRYPKTAWLARGNLLKLLGALIAMCSVWGGFWLQGVGYFIVGVGVSVYGPAKYGILPEILPRERLVKANGMVEMLTLIAILSGAIAGATLADVFSHQVLISYVILLGVYGLSWVLNLTMTPTPANPLVQFSDTIKEFVKHAGGIFTHPRLSRMLLGTALFWVCGVLMKINFQPWGLEVLGFTTNTQIALMGLWLSVGLMAGSVAAGALFPIGELRRTHYFIFLLAVPVAALSLMNVFPSWRTFAVTVQGIIIIFPVTFLLMTSGFVAGLFLIPLNASLQDESDHTKLGKTIAVQNLTDNVGMAVAGLICNRAVDLHISSSALFLVAAGLLAGASFFFRMPGQSPNSGTTQGVRPTGVPA